MKLLQFGGTESLSFTITAIQGLNCENFCLKILCHLNEVSLKKSNLHGNLNFSQYQSVTILQSCSLVSGLDP